MPSPQTFCLGAWYGSKGWMIVRSRFNCYSGQEGEGGRMCIEQLKYFLEVAQSGSINAVAQHLFISQQGISDALKRMENELGVVLFKRSKMGITLTPEGEGLYTYARNVVKAYGELEDYVLQLHTALTKATEHILKISVNPLSTTILLPDLLERLEKQQPQIILSCRDTTKIGEMVQQIQQQIADICIFMVMQFDDQQILQSISEQVAVYKLFEDELVACVLADSTLGRQKSISAADFKKLRKVLCDGAYDSAQDDEADFISNNVDFQLKLILKRQAAAVTIRYFFEKTFPHDLVTALPVKPAFKVNYYVMLPQKEWSETLRFLLQVLADYIAELTGQTVAYAHLLP